MSNNDSDTPRASWKGLSPDTRRRVIIQTVVYVMLVALAFRSLSKQSEADLRGPKSLWKGVIPASLTNFKAGSAWVAPVGPLLYFIVGKRRPRTA
ncbi:MAG: hypothetical protein RI637_05870 [Acidimicrobiia bacterium]|nr:hypothetical protein [Acidimicrobiia bacterium]